MRMSRAWETVTGAPRGLSLPAAVGVTLAESQAWRWALQRAGAMGFVCPTNLVRAADAADTLPTGPSGDALSWWAENFCAGSDASAVNIALTSLASTANTVVDEANRLVTVDAGIVTADLLDFLAGYGSGWTLPNFPWFTYATIGGQVPT